MSVWIDLENSPHVPFFLPIIRELEEHGLEVVLTARDFAQTRELLESANVSAKIIGTEYGANTFGKIIGLSGRALKLAQHVRGHNVKLAVGHGSRGLLLASKLLRIPALTFYDYEGASVKLFNRLSTFVMTPEVLRLESLEALGLEKRKYLTYPGLKEEVYLSEFIPDMGFPKSLGLDNEKIIVVLRPPSDTAHYRSVESDRLMKDVLALLDARSDVQLIVTPRTSEQKKFYSTLAAQSFGKMIVPMRAVSGADLLYFSDLVIGGGGTMNREAAVLGVPVVSIFKGALGAVDDELIRTGKMTELVSAVDLMPFFHKRDMNLRPQASHEVRDAIIRTIEALARA
jgi:predicted glycosyltransferase